MKSELTYLLEVIEEMDNKKVPITPELLIILIKSSMLKKTKEDTNYIISKK